MLIITYKSEELLAWLFLINSITYAFTFLIMCVFMYVGMFISRYGCECSCVCALGDRGQALSLCVFLNYSLHSFETGFPTEAGACLFD